MTTSLITTHKFEIGALYRRQVMIRLDELGLFYREHRTLVDSVIIVRVNTADDAQAFRIFNRDFVAFQARLQAIDDELDQEELDRKNFWRRLTLRKPLKSLPAKK